MLWFIYLFFNQVICTKPWKCWSWDDSTLHTGPLCFFKLSQKPSGLTFSPAFLRLPCAEIIGWHALTALFMTCFIKTATCIELGVCKGEFCFFALLGTGLRSQADHSQEDWPSSLASGKRSVTYTEKKLWCFCGFSTTWSHFSTHHLPCKSKKKKKKSGRTWDFSLIS